MTKINFVIQNYLSKDKNHFCRQNSFLSIRYANINLFAYKIDFCYLICKLDNKSQFCETKLNFVYKNEFCHDKSDFCPLKDNFV